ncbi:uncharacterized protein ACB057_007238 [Neosynchiropus ocellatus]
MANSFLSYQTHCHDPDGLQDRSSDRFEGLLQTLIVPPSDVCAEQGRALVSPLPTLSKRPKVAAAPTGTCGFAQVPVLQGPDGSTSVVTYGYIEKATVSRRSSACQGDLDQMLPRYKRYSDPFGSDASQKHGDSLSPRASPRPQGVVRDAVAWGATCRALEEFGSPELRRKFGSGHPQGLSPTLPRQGSQCWRSSPVQPRSTLTLPSRTIPLEPEWWTTVSGLPRSPASDQLSVHSSSPGMNAHQRRAQTDVTGPTPPNHGSWRPANACPPGSGTARSGGAPYAITGDTKSRMSPCSDGSRTLSPASSRVDSRRSESPKVGPFFREPPPYVYHCGPEHGQRLNQTPSPDAAKAQSRALLRTSCSSPTSPAMPARLLRPTASLSPVLDPRQRHMPAPLKDSSRWNQPAQFIRKTTGAEQRHSFSARVRGPSPNQAKGKPGPGVLTNRGAESQNGPGGTLSQSSSGVTGSLSPDVSSHSSHDAPEMVGHFEVEEVHVFAGGPASSQKRDGSTATRSQKIAQAKWAFLFGEEPARLHSDGTGVTSLQAASDPVITGAGPDLRHALTGELKASFRSSEGGPPCRSFVIRTPRLLVNTEAERGASRCGEGAWIEESSASARGSSDLVPRLRDGTRLSGGALHRSGRGTWLRVCFRCSDRSECRLDSTFVDSFTEAVRASAAPSSPSRRSGARARAKPSHQEVRQIEVELLAADCGSPAPKTGIIRRTIKYSETDLDAVPLRCYRETDLDEVMRAESAEDADSAFGSNRSSALGTCSFSPASSSPKPPRDQENPEEEEVVSWASVRLQGDLQRQRAAKDDDVFSLVLHRRVASVDHCLKSPLAVGGPKSPLPVGAPHRTSDSMDSFSRHFESIMESHRAKGTSYSSLDSVDLLTTGSTPVFTFDLPTLTPEIQSRICESAQQIMDLSFSPLVGPEASKSSRSELSLSVSAARPARDDGRVAPARSRPEPSVRVQKASSVPALHGSQRFALGGSDDSLANGWKPDRQAARRLAQRLYDLDGFKKSDVARHLSKNNEFGHMVAEEYLSHFDFSGLHLDEALRRLLSRFALIGESQERERVLTHFSRRFLQSHPETSQDSIHTLTCAVMLLNSDLHGNNVGKRMSCHQFVSNLDGLNDGKDFPKELLKSLYSSIKNDKLQWTIDEEELRCSSGPVDSRTDLASHTLKRLGTRRHPLLSQPSDEEVYKSGFLVRKIHADPDGKRTPRGRRSWKSFYVVLKGMMLHLQKDESRAERELTEEDMKNAVSVHHALAMRAADYHKRPNVFYLRTADWRVLLLQAPSGEQMRSWITRINVVAATFSAPPFPAAIGSQRRFTRPLLPASNTKLSPDKQVQSHENRFRAVSSELTELCAATPEPIIKGRELEEQKLRREYLEFEKTRFGTYAMLLRAKMAAGDGDLAAFESALLRDGGLQRTHSSPALELDSPLKDQIRRGKKSSSLHAASSRTPGGGGAKLRNGAAPDAHAEAASSRRTGDVAS